MKNDIPDLTKTAEAMRKYDRKNARFMEINFEVLKGQKEAEAEFERLKEEEKAVAVAFAEDTADRNSHDNAMLVTPDGNRGWLRKMLFNQGFEDCSPSQEVRKQRGWGW